MLVNKMQRALYLTNILQSLASVGTGTETHKLDNETETPGFRPQSFIIMVSGLLLWPIQNQFI